MAISDKLNYLIETKQLFKDRLNSLGAEIIESTTFRNYLTWLDTFYGKASDKTDLSENGIVGRTSQERTTGKNKINMTNGTYSSNGITAVVNNGAITLNGTATANSFVRFEIAPITLNSANTLSVFNTSTIGTLEKYACLRFNTGSSDDTETECLFDTLNNTKLINKSITYSILCIRTANGLSYNNFVITPMLEQGSTATSYEPYTGGEPSPNPDYPQEINNLSGDVEYKVRGKNFCGLKDQTITKNGVTFIVKDGVITANGTYTANTLTQFENKDNLVLNGNYTVKSFPISGSVSTPPNFNVKNSDGTTLANSVATSGSSVTFLVEESSLIYGIYAQRGTTFDNFKLKAQIEEGTTSTTYEPYISESFPLSLKSKNLFDGIWEQGGINGTSGNNEANNNAIRSVGYILVQPDTTYTISRTTKGNTFVLREYGKNKNFIGSQSPFNGYTEYYSKSFTTPSDVYYIRFVDYVNNMSNKAQLEKADNLFDINNALNNNLYNQGTSLSLITNGIRATTEAVSNYRMGLIKIGETSKLIGKTIRVKANFSSNGNNNGRFYIGYCDASGGNRVSKSDTTTSGHTLSMVVESGSGENICLALYSNNDGTNYTIGNYVDYKNIIITIDNEDTTYEPYYDINLCNISDYKDRIYSQNGKFYLEKKTGKVVLDGSEGWQTFSYGTNSWRLQNLINPLINDSVIAIMTTKFKGVSKNDRNTDNSVIYVDGSKVFTIRNTPYTTQAQAQSGMSGEPVYYVLATPTTTEITSENYPTLYSQLLAIQEFLTKYKINKEFLLDYSSPEIEY